jgi:diguanylate cyclase
MAQDFLEPASLQTPTGASIEHSLLQQRLRQVSVAVLVLLVISVVATAFDRVFNLTWLSLAGIVFLATTHVLNKRNHMVIASVVFLGTMTLITTAFMWWGFGVFGGTSMVFPAILILAAMLGGARVVLGFLVFMLAVVTFIAYATSVGWRTDLVLPITAGRVITLGITLSLSAGAAWLLSSDLRSALSRLRQENERVNQSRQRLIHLAAHDALTDLPNRALGQEYMEKSMASADRNGRKLALLFVDIDNFKSINDSLGHIAGDDFLRQVASRLKTAVRNSDIVCRQGGDEFLVILPDLADTSVVTLVVEQLHAQLSAPYTVKDTPLDSSCSVGIAMYPQDGNSFQTLLNAADTAMYQAKVAGRNTHRFFDEAMNQNMQEEVSLTMGLRQALARQEFVLYYQPVFNLQNRTLIGAEALIRWQHPERGLIPPMKFIPVAERSGLIVEIGEWVLQEACRQWDDWRSAGLPELVIAVNVSMVQMRRGDLTHVVQNALQSHAVPAQYLELELTESEILQDSEKFIELLQSLKVLGVKLSIDDFGTGYSNLSYLQRFDVDTLKVDQSFVRRLRDSRQDRAIVKAIIQMAKSLGLTTTAEGIEDEQMYRELRAMGSEYGQGYWFAKPMPTADFVAFANAHVQESTKPPVHL